MPRPNTTITISDNPERDALLQLIPAVRSDVMAAIVRVDGDTYISPNRSRFYESITMPVNDAGPIRTLDPITRLEPGLTTVDSYSWLTGDLVITHHFGKIERPYSDPIWLFRLIVRFYVTGTEGADRPADLSELVMKYPTRFGLLEPKSITFDPPLTDEQRALPNYGWNSKL